MASSVSSERAFSAAGITICKWCNRLDGDIVEALQCLKSFIHQDLMVRDIVTIAEAEAELDFLDEQHANQDRTTSEAVGWEDDALSVQGSDEGVDAAVATRPGPWLTECRSLISHCFLLSRADTTSLPLYLSISSPALGEILILALIVTRTSLTYF
jgi:hypothetical protein